MAPFLISWEITRNDRHLGANGVRDTPFAWCAADGMVTDAWFNVRALDGTILLEGTLTIRATRVTMNSPSPLEL